MDSCKIFIASSSKALTLAEQLRELLHNSGYCDARLWRDISKDKESSTIIEMLEGAIKDYDYAIIILTKDDLMVNAKGDVLKARDNCIFEAGLFMAAIGRKRCFLVNSVNQSDLPSDLGGIISIPFTEPQDFKDPNECTEKITSPSNIIKSAIYAAGPMKDRPLSPESLLRREKKIIEEGDLHEGQVVVASIQPLDLGFKTAMQVRHNIDVNIRYVYFFPGNIDSAEKIPLLLQYLLLAGIPGSKDEAEIYEKRCEQVKDNQNQILNDLKRICKNDGLKIYFRRTYPDLQFCIHNASDDRYAKMYVKHKETFIEWEYGKDAYEFWKELRKKHDAEYPEPPKAVFYGSPGFNIKEGTFFKALTSEFGKYFPEIDKEVMKLCLEGPDNK